MTRQPQRTIKIPVYCFLFGLVASSLLWGADYNQLILETIHEKMPKGGHYAKYQKSKPGGQFDDLYQTVEDLNKAVGSGLGGKLKVELDFRANAA